MFKWEQAQQNAFDI